MGRHKKAKQRKTVATVGVIGFAGATALASTGSTAQAASVSTWDKVASCESSGNWSINTGNGYYGGLQFTSSTWASYGGHVYAGQANRATKAQQITIAEKVLKGQGPGAWPVCGPRAGLQRGGPAPAVRAAPAVPKALPKAVPKSAPVVISQASKAVAYARSMIGTSYLLGGNGRGGIDCSGLTSSAWAHAGVHTPRVADAQWHQLPRVSLSHLQPGDIIAFGYSSGYANHVGLYVGGGMLIDTSSHRAGGGVGIQSLKSRAGGGSWHALGAVRPHSKSTTVQKAAPKWAKPRTESAPKAVPRVVPAPAPAEQAGMITHTVVPGDTLSHIARLYDVKGGWPAIFQANLDVIERYAEEHGAAADGNWIYPGQVIRIAGAQKT
jgi:cell wall-associated NlpC family hydrolase